MQDFLIALLIGFLLGWLLEWLIDWRYWRPTVRALRQENERLRRQLAGEDAPAEGSAPHSAESAAFTSVLADDKDA